MEEIVHIIIGSVIPALGGYLWGKLKSYRDNKAAEQAEYETIKKGLQSLLRDRMLQAYHCHLEQGFATTDDKGAFDAMHEAYAGLGKNGVMDQVYTEFMSLPEK